MELAIGYQLPKRAVVEIGQARAEQKVVSLKTFHEDLRYLIGHGASRVSIAQTLRVDEGSVRHWLQGHYPIDNDSVRVVTEWAEDLRQRLDGLASAQPFVSRSSSSKP